jgi:hypothetical protein
VLVVVSCKVVALDVVVAGDLLVVNTGSLSSSVVVDRKVVVRKEVALDVFGVRVRTDEVLRVTCAINYSKKDVVM